MSNDTHALLETLRLERGPSGQARRPFGLRALAVALVGLAGVCVPSAARFDFAAGLRDRLAGVGAPARSAALAPAAPARAAVAPPALIASGYVVARRKSAVASEVTGKLVELKIDEGSVVKKGDVIAMLDADLAERDLALAVSRVKSASASADAIEADLAEAERVLARVAALAQRGVDSNADLTKAQSRRDVLGAQARQAHEQVDVSEQEARRSENLLVKYAIRAPFDGVVIAKEAEVGELISPNAAGAGQVRTTVCTLIDLASLEVDVDVNEASIGRISPGMDVTVTLSSHPDATFSGSVFALAPSANKDKETVAVRVKLDKIDERFTPGLDAKVSFGADISDDAEARERISVRAD